MRRPTRALGFVTLLGVLLGTVGITSPGTTAPAQPRLSADAAPAAGLPAAPAARDACGRVIRKKSGRAWRCAFVENFDGRTLDRSVWLVQDSRRSRFSTGETCYRDSDENIRVRRGRLHLIVRKGPNRYCGAPRAFVTPFTGGAISSKGYFSQTYGRFEVRAKFPSTRESGLHGAFWMFPATWTYGRWPASGEIDVAEWWSSNPHKMIPSLHYRGRQWKLDTGRDCRVRHFDRFHTYRLLWKPTIMRFYIDGRQCFARRWTPDPPQERPQPFDHPFSIILNMGVTNRVGEKAITADTEFPSRFVVDYAKAWR